LFEASDRIRQRENERKGEAEEWRRKREDQAASQRQADQEKINSEGLEQPIGAWQKAQKFREVIIDVKKMYQPIPPSSELAGWIIGANHYANVLDPLCHSRFRKLCET
jgi:hypothetical protein